MNGLLTKVKTALRITAWEFDDEPIGLINACLLDLGIAGVDMETIGSGYLSNPLVVTAVITYCRLHFGTIPDGEYDRLKRSYDEQKAQMSMATGYTVWTNQESPI